MTIPGTPTAVTGEPAAAGEGGSQPGAEAPAVRTIVRLHDALDATTAPALRERLIGGLHPGTRLLILDLSGVPSCDSAGLAVLIGAQRHAHRLGITLRLAAPSVPVAKLLRRTGLDRNLTVCPDLRSAVEMDLPEPARTPPATQILAS
jgi:anti-anti-sigma factor